jgi:hypothetical protein
LATERLEGRGKAGKFGAIYEVIPVMEYVLSSLETRTRPYSLIDFNVHAEAPEDHLAINLRAAWRKADGYYNKLDDSPVYYAAVCLHPYYKHYCDNSWADKAEWLNTAKVGFQRLWAAYKPQRPRSSHSIKLLTNSIDDAIGAYVHRGSYRDAPVDEFECWKSLEPGWTRDQYEDNGNPVKYWIQLRPKYPNLARFAIDILSIPASSSDCERLFSELGDLLEPKRHHLGSEQLSALQLVRAWIKADFVPLYDKDDGKVTDEQIVNEYNIHEWDTPAP